MSRSESVNTFCLNDGCYLITVNGGTWQEEITWDLEDENGNIVLSGDAPYQEYFGVNSTCITVLGCTNPEALNYNELAGEDDGSCELPVVCEDNYGISGVANRPLSSGNIVGLITQMAIHYLP